MSALLDTPSTSRIVWNKVRCLAASMLATGHGKQEVADSCQISRATVYNWLEDPEFSAEVDRLSLMAGVASRAERLRIINRLVRQRIDAEGSVISEKDILDWLKFAQSETTGAKIDLSKLAEMLTGEAEPQQNQGISVSQGLLEASSGPAMDIQPEGIVETVEPVTDDDVKQPG